MASLRQGAHVCIATPGRLNDFLEAGVVDLYACRYLVFDEADRMCVSGVLSVAFTPSTRPHDRGRSTRSEWPRNRKKDHPRPRLMDTSRVDGVKAPQHRGTPRSHRIETLTL